MYCEKHVWKEHLVTKTLGHHLKCENCTLEVEVWPFHISFWDSSTGLIEFKDFPKEKKDVLSKLPI